MSTVITGEGIQIFRCLQLKYALKLELIGLRHSSGRSVAPLIREKIGSKTKNKKALLAEYEAWIIATYPPNSNS